MKFNAELKNIFFLWICRETKLTYNVFWENTTLTGLSERTHDGGGTLSAGHNSRAILVSTYAIKLVKPKTVINT